MITKIAFLPRILPGVFRPEAAATAGGYRMPHDRYFFYGISVSALLHVAVLYGFPARPVVERPPVPADPVIHVLPFDIVADEPPPPPPTTTKGEDTDAKKSDEGAEEYAHLPTPIVSPGVSDITVPGKLELGKLPDKSSLRWDPPKKPSVGNGNGTKEIVLNLKDLDKKPVATNRAAPRYPFEMKRVGIGGTVVMRFVVDSHGGVSDVEVLSADTPEFGKAAVEAMLRWRFDPGMKNGRRVATRMEMPMVFSLENNT